ncbi:nucleoid-associated protein Lsr2 [Amycolatopsis antarctica]|uniref:Nucleoid-associated protein Lsr2 n=1 Tax=Amycolatopsis antarctica TaxID=1854586 RepID=A0A263D0U4_9PSEU|nr:Lsr2 family protein [Amycolatopsis antarctica]OZM71839.1 nucleoid-associated protein Lsr2 [Amycolatopsis antarctica]
MAQKIETHWLDDLDGSDADETVSFELDGITYEIDLSAENADELRDALARYVEYGRRIGGRKRKATRAASPAATPELTQAESRQLNKKIRAWAIDNGYEISERGRIPADVIDDYEANN